MRIASRHRRIRRHLFSSHVTLALLLAASVASAVTYAGPGDVIVPNNATDTDIIVNAGGSATFAGNATATNLGVTASTGISQAAGGLTIAGNTTLTCTGGSIVLASGSNDFVGVFAANAGSSNISLADQNAISLGNITAANFGLATHGAITQTAPITNITTNLTSSDSSITLTDSTNHFGTVSANAGVGNIALTNQTGLVLGAITGNNLAVTANGSITQSGSVVVGNTTTLLSSNNAITLNGANNDFQTVAINAGTGNVTLTDQNSLVLGSIVAASLTATSHGAITQSAPLNAPPQVTLTSNNGAITLTQSTNHFANVKANAGTGAVAIVDQSAPTLGSIVAGSLGVTASGTVAQTAPLIVATTTNISSGDHPITLTNGGNDFGTFSASAGLGSVTVVDQNAIALGNVLTTTLAVTAGGSITQPSSATSLVVPTTATFTSVNSAITLGNAANDFGTINANAGMGSVLITDVNAIILGSLTAHDLTVNATSAAGVAAITSTPTAMFTINGIMTLNAGSKAVTLSNDVDLAFGANSVVTAGALTIVGSVTIPSLTTGVALDVHAGSSATLDVELNLEALGFTPTAETRLHAFKWNGIVPSLTITPGVVPTLPAGMTFDFSELGTTGDVVIRVCGDGNKAPTEVCDDGNTIVETSCPYGTATCTKCNATCTAVLNLTGKVCGDGTVDASETCDDGNAISETACAYGTPTCTKCNATCSAILNLAGPVCGDGTVNPSETCDDGNIISETKCLYGTPTCTKCNASCSAVLSLTGSYCGDHVLDVGEACDDGNGASGDGCSATCTVEVISDAGVDSGDAGGGFDSGSGTDSGTEPLPDSGTNPNPNADSGTGPIADSGTGTGTPSSDGGPPVANGGGGGGGDGGDSCSFATTPTHHSSAPLWLIGVFVAAVARRRRRRSTSRRAASR